MATDDVLGVQNRCAHIHDGAQVVGRDPLVDGRRDQHPPEDDGDENAAKAHQGERDHLQALKPTNAQRVVFPGLGT